ncbi:ABC transporter ATP-binding protein [Marinilactibacillus sp. Marseille-P9653]|uniref:ABC transporter ATP-binding protein n=1 Tax=Marinilactibacillus sp. Marseille-P9653 TaxID=2866583 RepID=UPI001CE3EE37|nr:ABC transporter ATP-binding protein [Marinilactibacillus sp. Marseille-P9653]
MGFLEVKHIKKVYTGRLGAKETTALKDVHFSVNEGEFVSVMGESGSGKTTLLNLLSTLDKPTEGEITLAGTPLTTIKEKELSKFRREQLGFVFQDFNLLDNFSLKDNILLPLVLEQMPVKEMEDRLKPLVEKLGISQLINNYPYEVSGGQKQRAAVARALITKPKLILADEPTGALDSKASEVLMNLFSDIHAMNQTILMVTHSARAASYSNRVLFIRDGEVYHEIYRGDQSTEVFMDRISKALLFSFDRGEQDEV